LKFIEILAKIKIITGPIIRAGSIRNITCGQGLSIKPVIHGGIPHTIPPIAQGIIIEKSSLQLYSECFGPL